MQSGAKDLENLAYSLAEQAANLQSAIQNVKLDIKDKATEKRKTVRAETAVREKSIRGFLHVGTPPVLAKWLFEVGAILPPETDEDNFEWNDEKFHLDTPSEEFDARTPTAWSPNGSSEAHDIGDSLRNIIPAYKKRLTEVSETLEKSIRKDSLDPNGARSAKMRISPKGGNKDTVESMSWAPQARAFQSMAPEAMRTFGAPWLVAGLPGSSRIGPNSWPAPGVGQFIIKTTGSAWLVSFPYAASLERGATMDATEDWLINLPPTNFNQFAKAHFQVVRLVQQSVVWIPYGWVTMLVNCRNTLDICQALVIPYLNANLAIGYPSLGLLVTFHIQLVKAHQANGQKHWKEHGDSYLEWLANLSNGPQGDIHAIEDSRAGAEVQALMDGQADSLPDEEDSQPVETQDEDSQQKDKEPEKGQQKDKELEGQKNDKAGQD